MARSDRSRTNRIDKFKYLPEMPARWPSFFTVAAGRPLALDLTFLEVETATAVMTMTPGVPTLVGGVYELETVSAVMTITAGEPTPRNENIYPPPAVLRTGSAQSETDSFTRGSLGANFIQYGGNASLVANVLETPAETADSIDWVFSGYDEYLGRTEIKFDFWVPNALDDGFHAYELDADRYIYVQNDSGGNWYVGTDDFFGIDITALVAANTWYTVKAYTEPQAGGAFKFKLYEQGDPEPAAWFYEDVYPSVSSQFPPFIFIDAEGGSPAAVDPSRMDNISISLVGQAPAVSWQVPAQPGVVTVTPGVPTLEYVLHFDFAFDSGGIATWTQDLVFNSGDTVAQTTFDLFFDVNGSTQFTQDFVFDVEGALATSFDFVFDVLGAATGVSTPTGATPSGPVSTTVAVDADAGDIVIIVTDATNIVVGSLLLIGTEYRIVLEVSGTSITLSAPLGFDEPAGTAVSNAPAFLPAMMIADKRGVILGAIPHASEQTGDGYTISDSPSRHIQQPGSPQAGSMSFYLPRTSPHSALLEVDRLVYLSTNTGTPAWAGPMVTISYGNGRIGVECTDLSALWGGPRHDLKEELATTVPGNTIFAKVLDLMNARRAVDSELIWESDLQVTNDYCGSVDFEDEQPADLFNRVSDRADCEYSWTVDAAGGELVATFVARNRFVSLSGGDILDGEDGNVAAEPVVDRTSDSMVHTIKLTGKQPDLFGDLRCFDWAIGDYAPEVTVEVDPGPYRRRETLEVSLDWGLAPDEQAAVEAQLRAQIDDMYERFLYAHHTEEGRPYHEGWVYEGPPSDLEPILHTGEGWRTRRHIATIPGQVGVDVAAAVMRNQVLKQILAVTYQRWNGIQTVRRYWYSEAGIVSARRMAINGYPRFWDESGGILTEDHRFIHDHRVAIVSEPFTARWVREDADGKIVTTFHRVVRVISLDEDPGGLPEGRVYEIAQPQGPWVGGDPPYQRFSFITVDADDVSVEDSYIYIIWQFERLRICDWDPRRDGIGARVSRLHVHNNAESTRIRWQKVAWSESTDGSTSITEILNATETQFPVENAFALPPKFGPSQPQYQAIINEGALDEEIVTVVRISGNLVTVIRTDGQVHEAGATISVKDPVEFNGLDIDYDWAHGRLYANRLLARLSRPFVRYRIQLVNIDGVWGSVEEGSVHDVTINTEGPTNEPITGQVRVLGFAPNVQDGTMEVIVEPYLP